MCRLPRHSHGGHVRSAGNVHWKPDQIITKLKQISAVWCARLGPVQHRQLRGHEALRCLNAFFSNHAPVKNVCQTASQRRGAFPAPRKDIYRLNRQSLVRAQGITARLLLVGPACGQTAPYDGLAQTSLKPQHVGAPMPAYGPGRAGTCT